MTSQPSPWRVDQGWFSRRLCFVKDFQAEDAFLVSRHGFSGFLLEDFGANGEVSPETKRPSPSSYFFFGLTQQVHNVHMYIYIYIYIYSSRC